MFFGDVSRDTSPIITHPISLIRPSRPCCFKRIGQNLRKTSRLSCITTTRLSKRVHPKKSTTGEKNSQESAQKKNLPKPKASTYLTSNHSASSLNEHLISTTSKQHSTPRQPSEVYYQTKGPHTKGRQEQCCIPTKL